MALDKGTRDAWIVRASKALGDTFDSYTLADIGPGLTCSESDALSELLRALDRQDQAETLESAHQSGDEEGDSHYDE